MLQQPAWAAYARAHCAYDAPFRSFRAAVVGLSDSDTPNGTSTIAEAAPDGSDHNQCGALSIDICAHAVSQPLHRIYSYV